MKWSETYTLKTINIGYLLRRPMDGIHQSAQGGKA